jgi:hypothetical protein
MSFKLVSNYDFTQQFNYWQSSRDIPNIRLVSRFDFIYIPRKLIYFVSQYVYTACNCKDTALVSVHKSHLALSPFYNLDCYHSLIV